MKKTTTGLIALVIAVLISLTINYLPESGKGFGKTAPQAPKVRQAPDCVDDTAVSKTCLCSDQCVCGCNKSGDCDCTVSQPYFSSSTKGVKQAPKTEAEGETKAPTLRVSNTTYYEWPDGVYRSAKPGTTEARSYVQPQQYAIPTQRVQYQQGSPLWGSCGPGGCR